MRAAIRDTVRPSPGTERAPVRRKRGAILFDALIATGILGMGAFAVCSFVPTVYHGQTYSHQETKATHMGARMVESVQMLPPSSLTCETLTALKLIDEGQKVAPYSFTHIPMDEGARYSPATALPKGTGTLNFTPLTDGAVKATVTITWESPYGSRTYRTGTIVGGYR